MRKAQEETHQRLASLTDENAALKRQVASVGEDVVSMRAAGYDQGTARARRLRRDCRARCQGAAVGGSAWESNPASPLSDERPVLKTGRATGPRSLPL